MNALMQIASALCRNDDLPNVELAERLAEARDWEGVAEIANGLKGNPAVASDCIKVLYEVGARRPELIAPYAEMFLDLLQSKNNRLVWGAMAALDPIAALNPIPVFERLDTVLAAYEKGSVITVDHAVSVLAGLCEAGADYEARVLPLLVLHLKNCRAKEIPQHLERMAVCLRKENASPITEIVRTRMREMSPAQQSRVRKVLKKIDA